MEAVNKFPIIVLGAGAGGLVVAIGGAKAGKKVLLIEKGSYGGDCTNFGCIPSKTLIASAEHAHFCKLKNYLGVTVSSAFVDSNGAFRRLREIVEKIRSQENPEALKKLGVETLTGTASFLTPYVLRVESMEGKVVTVEGRKIVIATGSSPFIPPIPGLRESPYLTNETIFSLKEVPKSLGVLGAGPIGCELAQAFSRLGSKVTLVESMRGIMPTEDHEVDKVMRMQFEKEGIDVFVRCDANRIAYENGQFNVCMQMGNEQKDVECEQLLVATGRRPALESLRLDQAKVIHSGKGIPVDQYGRTNQKHIFAIGDCIGGPQFTHLAENQGRAVMTSLLLPRPFLKKFSLQAVPHCTFTDPEVASIGLTEKEASIRRGGRKIAVYKVPFSEIDRAVTTGRTEGFVKIVTTKWKSQILGAVLVGPRAGEMLPEIALCMHKKIPLRKLAQLIHPYPTYNAAIRKCADLWFTQTILGVLKKQ